MLSLLASRGRAPPMMSGAKTRQIAAPADSARQLPTPRQKYTSAAAISSRPHISGPAGVHRGRRRGQVTAEADLPPTPGPHHGGAGAHSPAALPRPPVTSRPRLSRRDPAPPECGGLGTR